MGRSVWYSNGDERAELKIYLFKSSHFEPSLVRRARAQSQRTRSLPVDREGQASLIADLHEF